MISNLFTNIYNYNCIIIITIIIVSKHIQFKKSLSYLIINGITIYVVRAVLFVCIIHVHIYTCGPTIASWDIPNRILLFRQNSCSWVQVKMGKTNGIDRFPSFGHYSSFHMGPGPALTIWFIFIFLIENTPNIKF